MHLVISKIKDRRLQIFIRKNGTNTGLDGLTTYPQIILYTNMNGVNIEK